MILKNISIINYKNIKGANLELSPKINCLIGHNGMGKTNFLDAIYYLSFCRSANNPSIRRSSRTTRLSSCWKATTRVIMEIWRTSTAA